MTSRVRSRGKFSASSPLQRWGRNFAPPVGPSPTVWYNYENLAGPVIGEDEVMSDTLTPRWRERVRRGEILPSNPLSYRKRVVKVVSEGLGNLSDFIPTQNPPRTYKEEGGAWLYRYLQAAGYHPNPSTQPLRPDFIITSSEVEDLSREMSTQVLSKRGTADNNLFESVAEYKQTLALLRNPLASFHRLLRDPRKLKLADATSTAADTWLVYRYGVLPLIKDITGIIEGLEKRVGRIRKSTRAAKKISRHGGRLIKGSYSVATVTIDCQTVDTLSVRAVSLDEFFQTVANNIGFTAKGLITLPWELIPYSFVADWFVNVGDFIGALVPSLGLKQLSSSLTVRRSTSTSFTPVATATLVTTPEWPSSRPVSGILYAEEVTRTRSILSAPSIVIKSDFRFDQLTRSADALALIGQKLDRIIRR